MTLLLFPIAMLIVKILCKIKKKIGQYFYPTVLVCFHCCDKQHYLKQIKKKMTYLTL